MNTNAFKILQDFSETQQTELVLLGLQAKALMLEERIASIRTELDGQGHVESPLLEEAPKRKRPPLNALARRRIARAQKKRWAAYHRNKKRTMTA